MAWFHGNRPLPKANIEQPARRHMASAVAGWIFKGFIYMAVVWNVCHVLVIVNDDIDSIIINVIDDVTINNNSIDIYNNITLLLDSWLPTQTAETLGSSG